MWSWIKRLFHKKPELDPSSIGNILVQMGALNQDELEQMVAEFIMLKEQKLGEYIIQNSHVTQEQRDLAILRQKMMRGKANGKTIDELLELSETSSQKVQSSVEDLQAVAQAAAATRIH